jgi:hypothetical protein
MNSCLLGDRKVFSFAAAGCPTQRLYDSRSVTTANGAAATIRPQAAPGLKFYKARAFLPQI